jgi:hypothetical protein
MEVPFFPQQVDQIEVCSVIYHVKYIYLVLWKKKRKQSNNHFSMPLQGFVIQLPDR